MADQRTTDLDPIAALPNNGVLDVVDVDDTSEDPAGTSKKITKADFLKEVVADVLANTAKVGITTNQAAAILLNTEKVGISTDQAEAVLLNTAKVGITTGQSLAITANTSKVGYTDALVAAAPSVINNAAKADIALGGTADTLTSTVAANGQTTVNANSIFLKTGKTIEFRTSGATSGASISAFLFRANGTNVNIGFALTTIKSYILLEDFVSFRFFNNTDSLGYTALLNFISKTTLIERSVVVNSTDILAASAKADIALGGTADTLTSTVAANGQTTVNANSIFLKTGKTIEFRISGATLNASISVFLFRANGTFIQIAFALTTIKSYILLEDFVSFRFFNNTDSLGYTAILNFISKTTLIERSVASPLVRALVLGDSYSVAGTPWIPEMMANFRTGSSVISLAVSSATLRDKQTDRVANPYTSRPVSTTNTGNLNTVSCQIEKLKRLIAGTDLDPGESQIYTTVASRPNVIIIEGGMNDTFDVQAVEDTYTAQFSKQVDNVFYKQVGGSNIQGTFFIKTPISEVNRTSFAGSYRYLVEELSALFPDAQIFITLSSGLGYWNTNVVDRRVRTANQQRKSAQFCSASVIDWNGEGNVNAIVNFPSGSGTSGDPYILDLTVGSIDTNDAMHPNARGGKKYGRVAALTIKAKYINFNNE